MPEETNNDLKKKLQGFYDDASDNWQALKSDFNHSMEDLRKAFADFTKKK
jgi:hypothetical protein